MENVNVKLADGEVAFVSNGVSVIMNTATLLELCEKLGVDVDEVKKENTCECEKQCTCNCKKEDKEQDKNAGYRKLVEAILKEDEKPEDKREDKKENVVKTFEEFLNEILDELNDMLGEKSDEESEDEEDIDEEPEEDDEEECDDEYSRIVAVRYNPYSCDIDNDLGDDWRDGLMETLGVFESAQEAAQKFGITDINKVINSCDTWEAIGSLLSNKIIDTVDEEETDTVKDYAKDMLDKDIHIQLYCAPDCSGFHPDKDGIAFMYEDDIDDELPLYHEELFGEED